MTSLAGRTLTIIGGNGLVGSHVAKEAVNLGAKVISISRSGKPPQSKEPWTDKVSWVSGNAINPSSFESHLAESDAVLHTPGVLIDDVITKGKKPGEPGTYEYVNRDTAIALGKKLAELKNKKLVYMSASKSLPFIPRYLQAKREAENFLSGLPDLKFVSLRPGFITTNEIFVKKALKLPVDIYASVFSAVNNLLPDTRLKDFLGKNFDVDHSIDVRTVAIGAIIAAFDPKFDGKILYNNDLNSLTAIYLERGYKFPPKWV